MKRLPIFAAEPANPDLIDARGPGVSVAYSSADLPSVIQWMPAGLHKITAHRGGKAFSTEVQVDASGALAIQDAFQGLLSSGKQKPYFDFNHNHAEASAWPKRFFWSESPEPGIYADVEWSKPGADAVTGRAYRAFSPTFTIDGSKPPRPNGSTLNMGGLVNEPAFKAIAPLFAKDGNPLPSQSNKPTNRMNKIQTLIALLTAVNAAIQARHALSAKTDGDHTAEISAKDAEISTQQATVQNLIKEIQAEDAKADISAQIIAAKDAELALANARVQTAETVIKARRKADAKLAVDAAVARGALPAQDTAIQAKWTSIIEADPDAARLLEAASTLVGSKVVGRPGAKVEITRESTEGVICAYHAEKNPHKRGLIYANEIDKRIAANEIIPWERINNSIEATNAFGDVAGTLVAQRSLALIYSLRPDLKAFANDFSDAKALYGQQISTRKFSVGTVADFGSASTDRADTNYPVTMNLHKQVQAEFSSAEVSSTARNLIQESAEPNAVALGFYLADTAAALITTAFTGVNTTATASVDYTTLIAITTALNKAGVPPQNRFGLVNSDVAQSLKNDEIIIANAVRDTELAYSQWKNLEGFKNIFEYPNLPTTSNLTGFFGHPDAIIIAARIPQDPAVLAGAGYPGVLEVVTDPISGLSVLNNRYVDQVSLKIVSRLIIMLGVARGNLTSGYRLVSA